MKDRSRVRPIGTRESRNNSSLNMLPSSSNQLEGELDINIPTIDDSRRVNRQERRPRRKREPIVDRIGSAIDDTLMDAPRDDEDEVQHDVEQEVERNQNVENSVDQPEVVNEEMNENDPLMMNELSPEEMSEDDTVEEEYDRERYPEGLDADLERLFQESEDVLLAEKDMCEIEPDQNYELDINLDDLGEDIEKIQNHIAH